MILIVQAAYKLGARSFLDVNSGFFAHGGKDNDVNIFALLSEELLDLLFDLALRNLDIVLGASVVRHKGKEAIIGNIKKLIFLAADVGNVHIVSGWAKVLQLLPGENVNRDKMDLGVTVFASLRRGHFDDLARTVLDDDEAVLPQGRALHRVGGRGTGIGALEGMLMLGIIVGHGGNERRVLRLYRVQRRINKESEEGEVEAFPDD